MCELKVDHSAADTDTGLVENVLAVIERHSAHRWSAVHSFDPEIVRASREAAPQISAAIISPPVDADGMERLLSAVLKRNAQAVSVEHSCLSPKLVLAARRRQVTVWAWTADSPADWQRLADAGVAGIITNVPHRMRAFFGG